MGNHDPIFHNQFVESAIVQDLYKLTNVGHYNAQINNQLYNYMVYF